MSSSVLQAPRLETAAVLRKDEDVVIPAAHSTSLKYFPYPSLLIDDSAETGQAAAAAVLRKDAVVIPAAHSTGHAPTIANQFATTKTMYPDTPMPYDISDLRCWNLEKLNWKKLLENSYDERDNKTNNGNEEMFIIMRPQHFIMHDRFHREDERLKTFANWEHPLNKKQLAMLGMFYTGDEDKVKCYFCEVEIGRWEPEDEPLSEHMRWSPNCPLLRRRTTNNVPIDAEALDRCLPAVSFDTCGISLDPHTDAVQSASNDASPGDLASQAAQAASSDASSAGNNARDNLLEYPEYSIEAARVRSYTDWPLYMKQKPAVLAEAGFFYTGLGDRVKCFSCGGGLKDWAESDEPWEQHALWMPTCRYLRLMKGALYIDAIKDKYCSDSIPANASTSRNTAAGKAPVDTAPPADNAQVTPQPRDVVEKFSTAPVAVASAEATSATSACESANDDKHVLCALRNQGSPAKTMAPSERKASAGISEEKICKICYATEYNTCFLPCSHVVACAKCASSVTLCPVCRVPIKDVVRLYFS